MKYILQVIVFGTMTPAIFTYILFYATQVCMQCVLKIVLILYRDISVKMAPSQGWPVGFLMWVFCKKPTGFFGLGFIKKTGYLGFLIKPSFLRNYRLKIYVSKKFIFEKKLFFLL